MKLVFCLAFLALIAVVLTQVDAKSSQEGKDKAESRKDKGEEGKSSQEGKDKGESRKDESRKDKGDDGKKGDKQKGERKGDDKPSEGGEVASPVAEAARRAIASLIRRRRDVGQGQSGHEGSSGRNGQSGMSSFKAHGDNPHVAIMSYFF